MLFSDVQNLLASTQNDAGVLAPARSTGRVLVSPSLAGRVMGTAYAGESGAFGGFVDADAFKHGMSDIWDNWGGEERYWLCPEGGQFGLMFQGKENCFDNYHVQDGINNSRYTVVDQPATGDALTMKAAFQLVNAAGTEFDVESVRRITALADSPLAVDRHGEVETIGFQSESTLTNVGANRWTRESGGLTHWHLGQFLPGEHTIVIIPFRTGQLTDPLIREDYFREFCIGGTMPENRHWTKDGFALFKADGTCRTKISQNRSRATGSLASYNLQTDEIVLMEYDLSPRLDYAASYWYEQPEPFNGDCVSFSAEGPRVPGESYTFRIRTHHLRGPRAVIAEICQAHLGPEISILEAFDRQC